MLDKQLTQESGFFSYLEPGDVVLADCSFTIVADVAVQGGKAGNNCLHPREVELSKQLSMERIFSLLKNKYTLLKGPIPVNLFKHKLGRY